MRFFRFNESSISLRAWEPLFMYRGLDFLSPWTAAFAIAILFWAITSCRGENAFFI
ncbi:hypothetical protein [Flammeovirga agarivorans]|uniref:Uncharacterized protein n=1 Tax=Flammeovirga agarivorans TaxID=2726742 RepID=A0A7X8SRG6_9BACT|nr:hypothetical protein [Flammeovirga agarivorans]NLR94897.1 hypothetical protein [Flammeovirga agarivorans]